MQDKVYVPINPSAYRIKEILEKQKLFQNLDYYGIKYKAHESESEKDLRKRVSEAIRDYEIFISVGGDGTHDLVANEILKKDGNNILAMIGAGFSNDTVKGLGINNLELICKGIKDEQIEKMDVGCVAADNMQNYFLGSLVIGVIPEVNESVDKFLEKHPDFSNAKIIGGALPFVREFSKFCLLKKIVKLELNNKSPTLFSPYIIFNNVSNYCTLYKKIEANPFDGKLNAYITESPMAFLHSMILSALNDLDLKPKPRDIKYMLSFNSEKFYVSSEEGFKFQLDGIPTMEAVKEIEVSAKHKALKIIYPKK